MGCNLVSFKKSLSAVLALGATVATSAFAVTAPDLPMAGWATQNGGTTGGAGKSVVTVSNVSDLRKYAEAGNYTIYVKPGTYTVPSKSAIKVGSNVTIYGYQGAVLAQTYTGNKDEDNTIMNVAGKNVIIRNLTFKGAGAVDKDAGDCLHVQGGTNVWLDHLDVYDGEDGNLDVINGANYVTISWTRFHYTSASKEHQFSNLIGNSDNKTTDDGKLKTTLHHNWWDDGVKERMPRVRYGQVHVANNLFTTNSSSTCVRAGKSADLRVENNVFIGVNNPIDLYNGDYKAVYSGGNYTENIKKGDAKGDAKSGAFTPSYSMKLTDVSNQSKAYALRDSIKLYAGATLPDPGSTQVTPVSSSSVQQSSSSQAKSSSSQAKSSSSSVVPVSSSSVAVSSSSVIAGEATLTKHGTGSSNQEVAQGAAIVEFYYTIAGATGASVTGLPQGVTGTLKGMDYYISGTVASTVAPGAYKFTVTTTGASKNATKSGTITVAGTGFGAGTGATVPASSSSITESSSSESESSSSETVPGSSESSETSTTALNVSQAPHFNVSIEGRTISVLGATRAAYLLDAQGKLIAKVQPTGNVCSIAVPRAGSYLLRIGNELRRVSVR